MEEVAQKIRKDQSLSRNDLETWVEYNYLVLNEDDQAKVNRFI